jgi:hypothetical protein
MGDATTSLGFPNGMDVRAARERAQPQTVVWFTLNHENERKVLGSHSSRVFKPFRYAIGPAGALMNPLRGC